MARGGQGEFVWPLLEAETVKVVMDSTFLMAERSAGPCPHAQQRARGQDRSDDGLSVGGPATLHAFINGAPWRHPPAARFAHHAKSSQPKCRHAQRGAQLHRVPSYAKYCGKQVVQMVPSPRSPAQRQQRHGPVQGKIQHP